MHKFFHNYQFEYHSLKKRYKKERIFKFLSFASILLLCIFLGIVIFSIASKSIGALKSYELEVALNGNLQEREEIENFLENVIKKNSGFKAEDFFAKSAIYEVKKCNEQKQAWLNVSTEVAEIAEIVLQNDYVDSNIQKERFIMKLLEEGKLRKSFNFRFFSNSNSTAAEDAGILGAILGTIYSLLICFAIAVPLSVMTAVYLEEFSGNNKFTYFIEININNLSAIPSIVFGMLGLALYIGFFGMPRSSSLVGGMTLALMSMPTIIIASRQALASVPKAIKENALALGASKLQVITHHLLPLSLPGILTGVILAVARAAGETAPLILIGMVAFTVDLPHDVLDPAASLPVQIYLWSENPKTAFMQKTSLAILVLLSFIMILNLIAVLIRKKYEKKW